MGKAGYEQWLLVCMTFYGFEGTVKPVCNDHLYDKIH